MWKVIAVFATLFIGWWLLLWGLLPPSWNQLTLGALLIIYLLPPALAGLIWLAWRGKQAKRDAAARATAEQRAEQEREAKRAAAREQHLQDLAQRQQTISCRMVLARALPGRSPAGWLGSEPECCSWQPLQSDELQQGHPLQSMSGATHSLLTELYGMAPGAAWLPIYMLALPDEAGQTQLAHITELSSQAMLSVSAITNTPAPIVRFLPGSGSIAERARQVLQQESCHPGLLVLAIDAPAARLDPDDEPDNEARQQRAWSGQPGAAVVALLFLRDILSESVPDTFTSVSADPYQPYWEKDLSRSSDWGSVPSSQQPSLAALPVLARLSQAVGQETASASGPHLTGPLQTALDNALVNAALVDYPFSDAEHDPANDKASSIGWLVHNSGDAHVGGNRLAALGNALSYHNVLINPVEQASNLVREWGDTGHSAPALATALAITHCARLSTPVVLAHFEPNSLNIGLACPATTA